MKNIELQYQNLLTPSADLIRDISSLDGDIMILGVSGKMGPGLARKAKQAVDAAGIRKRIIGVARFSDPGLVQELQQDGIEIISANLLDDDQLWALPEVKNILYLAGTKFGTYGNEPQTWAMNAYLPGRVAQKFKKSRIVVFSTGNVYPLLAEASGGATEIQGPEPIGEYAQSCLGRERIFQYFSGKNQTPILIFRLNYAIDVTYGILLEIAKSIHGNLPIDLSMKSVNIIWQGDANEIALRSLHHCTLPAKVLNVTGPEILSVRHLAEEFGKKFNTTPHFVGEEQSTSLLSNASESIRLFGLPKVQLSQMVSLVAEWLIQGGKTLNKPTHFSERKGKF